MSPSKPVARIAAAQRYRSERRARVWPTSGCSASSSSPPISTGSRTSNYRFTVYRPSGAPDAEARRPRRQDELGVLRRIAGDRRLGAVRRDARAARAVPRRHCTASRTPADGVRYLSFSGQPIFDQRNKFKGYRGIARDVSAQIRAERLAKLEHTIAHTLAEADDIAAGLDGRHSRNVRSASDGRPATSGASTRNATRSGTKSVGTPTARIGARCLNAGDRLPTWLSHGPVWIGDVIRDPRTSRLERVGKPTGWNTGLVIPVKSAARRSACSISTRRESRRPSRSS